MVTTSRVFPWWREHSISVVAASQDEGTREEEFVRRTGGGDKFPLPQFGAGETLFARLMRREVRLAELGDGQGTASLDTANEDQRYRNRKPKKIFDQLYRSLKDVWTEDNSAAPENSLLRVRVSFSSSSFAGESVG